AGEDGEHAGRFQRDGAVDGADARVSVGRAHDERVRLAGQRHVVGIAADALAEARIFETTHGLSHPELLGNHGLAHAITLSRRRCSISFSLKPASHSTSTVCSPMPGASAGGTLSWPSIVMGLLTVSAAPARGSAIGTRAPLACICSSVGMSSSV